MRGIKEFRSTAVATAVVFFLIFLSLHDIIKDPLIFTNAVTDMQADVSTKPKQNARKNENIFMHFIDVPCAFNGQTPANGSLFFCRFVLFFLLSNKICLSPIARSYDCFLFLWTMIFFHNLGEPILLIQAKVI